jgi:hypothetical protein
LRLPGVLLPSGNAVGPKFSACRAWATGIEQYEKIERNAETALPQKRNKACGKRKFRVSSGKERVVWCC